MHRALDNPDRDFSATPISEPKRTDLRDLLNKSEIADMLDLMVEQRVGEMIGRLGFAPSKQKW